MGVSRASVLGFRRAETLGKIILGVFLLISPCCFADEPGPGLPAPDLPGVPTLPDLLKDNCTYLGPGVIGGGSNIVTDKNEALTLDDVSLIYQCGPLANAADSETQKEYGKAVEAYATRMVYENVSTSKGKCRVIASQGSSSRLTARPNDPKSYLYFTDELLVQYHASFECRTPVPHGHKSPP